MTDWSLVGGDPAPGDPDALDRRCGHLGRAVAALRTVDRELGKIIDGTTEANWQGRAAEAMRDTLSAYRGDLRPIADSFDGVVAVLRTHAGTLRELQARARRAVQRAQVAKAAKERSESSLASTRAAIASQRSSLQGSEQAEWRHYERSVADAGLNDPQVSVNNADTARHLAERSRQIRAGLAEKDHERARLEGAVRSAQADLDAAGKTARDVRDDWDEASRATARRVDAALDDSLRNKSNLEKFIGKAGEYLGSVGQLFVDIADFLRNPSWESFRKMLGGISAILGLLAVVAVVAAFVLAPFTGGASVAALFAFGALLAKGSFVVAAAKAGVTGGMLLAGRTSVTKGDFVLDVMAAALAGAGAKGAGSIGTLGKVTGQGFTLPAVRIVGKEVSKELGKHVGQEVGMGFLDEYGKPYIDMGLENVPVPILVPPLMLPPLLSPVPSPPVIRIPALRLDLIRDVSVRVGVGAEVQVGIGR